MTALKLLAIETSSATGSVALAVGDEIREATIATPREQTSRVLALVDELLAGAGLELGHLDALVYGRGPGSFTGLRVAAAVAQGLSLAVGTPIVGVSSLAALAQRALGPGAGAGVGAGTGPGAGAGARARAGAGPVDPAATSALCLVDARMGEVYSGCFRLGQGDALGLAEAIAEERIAPPEQVTPPAGAYLAVGDALFAYADALSGVSAGAVAVLPGLGPRARDLLPLAAAEVRAGRFVPLEAALPVYLRGADAWQRS